MEMPLFNPTLEKTNMPTNLTEKLTEMTKRTVSETGVIIKGPL